jgi:hypothetical protein
MQVAANTSTTSNAHSHHTRSPRHWLPLLLLAVLLSAVWQTRGAEAEAGAAPQSDVQLSSAAMAQASSAVPNNIRQKLLRGGVNLVFDFYDVDTYNPNGFDSDLPRIANAGAGHVRLPISMDIIEDGATGMLREDRYQDIVNFVNRARNSGLVTIIDIHNTGQKNPDGTWTNDYMGGLRDPAIRARHASLVIEFVRRLYEDRVRRDWFVFQPANEPIFGDGDANIWYDHQAQILPAMRAACPDCVIFAMANDWQGAGATVANIDPTVAPFNDPYLIFDVHFYDPMPLTHCSPDWVSPCDPGIVWPGNFSTWRGTFFWDREFVNQLLQPLWDWKNNHNVFVHFSEFGASNQLNIEARTAYYRDIVSVFREHGVGYSAYDWRGTYSIQDQPGILSAVFGR